MYTKPFQGGYSRAPSTVFHQPARRSQPFPTGCCWLYQKGWKCNTRNCLFKHCVRNVRPPTQLAHVASNPLILRLLNAALTEGTRQAYKLAVTAFSITHSSLTPVYPLPSQSCIRLLMPLPVLFHLTMSATCSKACFCCPFMLSYI